LGLAFPCIMDGMNEIEVLELRNRLEVAERERDEAMADAERYAFLKSRPSGWRTWR